MKLAKELKLNVVGVSFYTGQVSAEAYERGMHLSNQLFHYAKSIGFNFNYLDIGGDFSGDDGDISSIANVYVFTQSKY